MRWALGLGVVFGLVACSDYTIEDIPIPITDDDDTDDTDDTDETGTPDTGDLSCPDRIWGAGTVGIDEACLIEPPVGTFNPIIEWSYFSFDEYSSYRGTLMTPVVGQLTDDNEDGIVDESDVPDIALVQFYSGRQGVLRLVSGDGSGVHWTVYDSRYEEQTYWPYRYSGAALGDVDGDEQPDIVTTVMNSSNACFPGMYDASGVLKWVSTSHSVYCGGNAPALADLTGDGTVEVVFGALIIEGATGTVLSAGEWGSGRDAKYVNSGLHAFAVDLEVDGHQEVITGSAIYESDGSLRCVTGYADGYPAVADLDGDGAGEIVVTGGGMISVFDSDCWLIDSWSVDSGGHGGPATIADYDGDGLPEIGVAERVAYTCYETDGTVLWENLVEDYSSHSTGSSVYDFEGDGYAEVVYADEQTLWIYQGSTGRIRLAETTHQSGTVNEYPVVVDVDGDGEVEIVVPDAKGVYVVGDEDHSWVAARQVWNQSAYSITNIEDDLTVPVSPDANWPTFNSFRSGDITPNVGATLADPLPVWLDICLDDCEDGVVQLVVQIANGGLADIPTGYPIQVIWEELDGTRRILDEQYSTFEVLSGRTSEGLVFRLDREAVAGDGALLIVVPTDVGLEDCNPDNNEWVVDVAFRCPEEE